MAKKSSKGADGRSAKTGRFVATKKAAKGAVEVAAKKGKRKPGNPNHTTKG